VRLRHDWAPIGAARFMELIEAGFFQGVYFHRVLKGSLAQFGLPADPAVYETWKNKVLPEEAGDEATKITNSRGTLSFASRGEGTRCCQVFINLCHNKSFDHQGFTPFAEIVKGMDALDGLFSGYSEVSPKGTGPDPERIKQEGANYLKEAFPKLSCIVATQVLSRAEDGTVHRGSLTKETGYVSEGKSVTWNEGDLPLVDLLPKPKLSSPRAVEDILVLRKGTPSPVGSGLEAVKAKRKISV